MLTQFIKKNLRQIKLQASKFMAKPIKGFRKMSYHHIS